MRIGTLLYSFYTATKESPLTLSMNMLSRSCIHSFLPEGISYANVLPQATVKAL